MLKLNKFSSVFLKPFSSFKFSHLIKSGLIVNSDEHFKADILLKNGKISKIFRDHDLHLLKDYLKPDTEVIDAQGKYVIPGGIDPHTHLQLPFMGGVSVDDFNIGTKAAISGGTTTLIDFAIPDPQESLLKAYDQWRAWADPKVNCDYSLHMAITSWSEQIKKEMAEIVNRGVNSFKVFLAYKGALMLNDSDFLNVLERCKELGAVCMVHAENGELVQRAQKKILEMGIIGPEGHYLSRPEIFESESTHKAVIFSEFVNTPLYVVHVMSKDAAQQVILLIF